MLEPQCPHCTRRVELLSAPWQAQKGSPFRACPFCGGRVEAKFKAGIYAAWLAALVAAAAVAGLLWGPRGFSALFIAALVAPLVPSIYLADAA